MQLLSILFVSETVLKSKSIKYKLLSILCKIRTTLIVLLLSLEPSLEIVLLPVPLLVVELVEVQDLLEDLAIFKLRTLNSQLPSELVCKKQMDQLSKHHQLLPQFSLSQQLKFPNPSNPLKLNLRQTTSSQQSNSYSSWQFR